MKEKIMPCGDDCFACPRYTATTNEELQYVAELWYKVGYTDTIVSTEIIKCTGCSSNKSCEYGLLDCIKERNIRKCNQCSDFPCDKINKMLEKSKEYDARSRKACSEKEYLILKKAFYEKEINLQKEQEMDLSFGPGDK